MNIAGKEIDSGSGLTEISKAIPRMRKTMASVRRTSGIVLKRIGTKKASVLHRFTPPPCPPLPDPQSHGDHDRRYFDGKARHTLHGSTSKRARKLIRTENLQFMLSHGMQRRQGQTMFFSSTQNVSYKKLKAHFEMQIASLSSNNP